MSRHRHVASMIDEYYDDYDDDYYDDYDDDGEYYAPPPPKPKVTPKGLGLKFEILLSIFTDSM